MKVGVLDLGSNSFQLLVATASGPNDLSEHGLKRATLQLETALKQPGLGSEEAQKHALAAVGSLIRWARSLDNKMPIIAVAKRGLQDTPEGVEFLQALRRRYGITVELLDSESEAKLTYRGVRSQLAEVRERLGIIDIGGGSVEVSVGQRRFCFFGASLPCGFLRVQDIDTNEQLRQQLREQFATTVRSVAGLGPERWVMSGGTARAFGRVAIALSMMHGGQIQNNGVIALANHVRRLPRERLAELGVPHNRTALFPQAARLLAELVHCFSIPAIGIASGGLRQGLVLREYERACFAGMSQRDPRANWDRG
jgi:exopolyphosphatase/guanosine-5'-triphosphate,3'-diphosphate pyrophosphatase